MERKPSIETSQDDTVVSQFGKLIHGTKSDHVGCLEGLVPPDVNTDTPVTNVMILDGAAIVHLLQPGSAKIFSDYAMHVFLPYIESQLQKAFRVEVVWDEYLPHSIKAGTRQRRGKGVRRRVEAIGFIPRNWQEFLRLDENRSEPFSFLAVRVVSMSTEKRVISSHYATVLFTQHKDASGNHVTMKRQSQE
ncbi:hypothetical protein Hamer_G005533 [Homarus americanus]|uniref:Uncharacterized protein n=1 Tax=Homarus americanus TaxID=6706 RepID=A0A8J5MWH4_HOMAM|nr:hypothetical protein Hamer_G005533 [Homarus americanus]